jgi:hypothetical protein
LLTLAESESMGELKSFLSLYVLTLMHGSSIELAEGNKAILIAGFANSQRTLEAKIEFKFSDFSKPLSAPACMFFTSLKPDKHCNEELIKMGTDALYFAWDQPIEIGADGKLALVA